VTKRHWLWVKGSINIVLAVWVIYFLIATAGWIAAAAISYLWCSMLLAEWRIRELEVELKDQARRLRDIRRWQEHHNPAVGMVFGGRPTRGRTH
jgi:hypothetical protein